jgi:hypothetical protein
MPIVLLANFTTTALQLWRDALGLTNAVGVDQTLTAAETEDCLRVLNQLIDSWSTQNLAVFGQANQSFNTVVGQAVYTIGAGANWDTVRPVRIHDQAYSTYQGVSFPCVKITQEEYNGIPLKTQQQEFPDYFLYVNEFPLGLVTLYPVPSAIVPVTFTIDRVMDGVLSAATVLSFPPGYLRAFRYALAVELAPWFGKKITDYPEIVNLAATTFANIKRTNKKPRVMKVDPAFSDGGHAGGDWRTG